MFKMFVSCMFLSTDADNVTSQAGCDVNPPGSGAQEVHGGDERGLKPPGGAGAASRDTEGGRGDSGV